MLRPALAAAAVLAAAALSAPAADPDLTGNWLLSYTSRGGATEVNYAILKVETKDGKPTATVVATPGKGTAPTVKEFKVSGKQVTVALGNGPSFVGAIGADPKQILGGFGDDRLQFRGKLARTDKEAIDAQFTKGDALRQMTEAQRLATQPLILRAQAQREQDAEKKKDLTRQAADAQKVADEKVPALYREVVAEHADHPAAMDAAISLLQASPKVPLSAEEAGKLVALVEKQAAPYGERFTRFHMIQVLPALQAALEKAGKKGEAKAVAARLAKYEAVLDKEYLAKVPPFKPAAFAGRKDSAANRVAVMELFTGAQCPPCVAADVAFDALAKSYKPTDLVLIQYHLHIPGPDPMTNPVTQARARYYSVNSTPSTFFNGKKEAGGGGGMAQAEAKYKQYAGVIDPVLEQATPVKVTGRATRAGDRVSIAVEVDGADGDDLRLRLVVVEETVKFAGGNGLRFHHHVVRAMPGGADGVAIKDRSLRHTATADVGEVRAGLEKYLTEYAEARPFPQPGRPLDMGHLKVIALVQSDKTKEILQAVQMEVEGGAAGSSR